MSDKIDLTEKLSTFTDYFSPRTVAQLNDYDLLPRRNAARHYADMVWHSKPKDDAWRRAHLEMVQGLGRRLAGVGREAMGAASGQLFSTGLWVEGRKPQCTLAYESAAVTRGDDPRWQHQEK